MQHAREAHHFSDMLHAGEDLLVRGDLDAVKSSLSKQQNVVTTLKSQLVSPSVSTFVTFQKLNSWG